VTFTVHSKLYDDRKTRGRHGGNKKILSTEVLLALADGSDVLKGRLTFSRSYSCNGLTVT